MAQGTLQQVDRTCVLLNREKLVFFGGCDYFRLSSHPLVLKGVQLGLAKYGLSVAASRVTTGNHRAYAELEAQLAKFFGAPSALLVSNGYLAATAATQALAGQFTHALIDDRSHAALFDAALALRCPVIPFSHRNPKSLQKLVDKHTGSWRQILLTDGLFSHDGSVAPLHRYREILPETAWMLIDDAHSAGVLGGRGQGTLEYAGISRARTIQAITLSKAVGAFGGAVLCSKQVRAEIFTKSRSFIGSTPIPLPMACAATSALGVLSDQPQLRRKLFANTAYVRKKLIQAGLPVEPTPGPIVALPALPGQATRTLHLALMAAGIYPTLIRYLNTNSVGYYRFVISSEHTMEQLGRLASVLTQTWPRLRNM